MMNSTYLATETTIDMLMTATDIPLWVWLHKIIAPWLSILVFCAPIPTLQQITKDRTVGSLPLLPYTSMIASAFLWTTYGWLNHESTIYMSNSVGLVLGVYYTFRFTRFAPSVSSTLPGSVQNHLLALAAVMAATIVTVLAFSRETSSLWIGRVAVVFCLAMFASPLAALKTVLETKSAASIPLSFTLASTVNCYAWVIVGLFDMHDPNVWGTNGIALLFGLIQIALKIVFHDGVNGVKKEEDNMRVGLLYNLA